MKKLQTASSMFLIFLLVGCVAQSEVVRPASVPTQMAIPGFTSTLSIIPTEIIPLKETPSVAPTPESLTQLPSLSLPEFNARYSTADIALSLDGNFIAVVSKNKYNGDKGIWVWDAKDFDQSIAAYQVLVNDLWSVAFSPDGTELMIGCSEKIFVLDWRIGKILNIISIPNSEATQVAYGPKNTLVSAGFDNIVTVRDLSHDEVKYSVPGIVGFYPNSFAISPDGKVLITADVLDIQFWDMATGQSLGSREGTSAGIGIAPATIFSSKGTFLASTGCSEFIFESCSKGKIIIWKSDSTLPSIISEAHPGWIRGVAFSPDEGTLASISGEGTISLMNLSDGRITTVPSAEILGKLPPLELFLISDVDFLSDGKILIVSTYDGIQLLDIASMSWMPNLDFILSLGNTYSITTAGDNLNLRTKPSINGEIINKLHTGDRFGIIDGPKIADEYVWWKVKIADDTEGWIVEMPGWYEFAP